jgi:hypothetical protein
MVNGVPATVIPGLPELYAAAIRALLDQQQPCLYRQAVQCQEALTQIISPPQRGQELSDVVLAAVRRPEVQRDAGWVDAIGRR